MFRITQYMEELAKPTPLGPKRAPPGPVVIWNLIRRCNLACRHCYTNSFDREFAGELNTAEVYSVMEDLKRFGVPVLILSGGEPLLRPDIFDLAARARSMGFYTGLSTNGTFIDQPTAERIAALGLNYVGISIDGLGPTHDRFRNSPGSFDAALRGVRLCREVGIRVGLRFTLTQETAHDLPGLLQLMRDEDVDKFYLSHLNYAGRGNKNRKDDAHFAMTRAAMELLFEAAWGSVQAGAPRDFVTGNNDADAVFLLRWAQARMPERTAHLRKKLEQWGGNATGVNIANIDNLGNVHPDTYFSSHTLGNVRERPFSQLWTDLSDPVLRGLKGERQTHLKGRCGTCGFVAICNGNTRVRALEVSGDMWAEDPGCYLDDAELSAAL